MIPTGINQTAILTPNYVL